MRIGIYVGSFNPVHNAHLDIANRAIEENLVDRVIFVPAGDGYEKRDLICGSHRYKMLELAIQGNLKLSVSDIEIVNNKLYTYQTLDYFKDHFPNDEIYLVMGSDNLNEFSKWKKNDYILDNYKLIVFLRNNQRKEGFINYKNKNLAFIEYDFVLSSSEVREYIKRNNYSGVVLKISKDVLNYIKENNLYK